MDAGYQIELSYAQTLGGQGSVEAAAIRLAENPGNFAGIPDPDSAARAMAVATANETRFNQSV